MIYFHEHTEAIAEAWKKAQKNLREYRDAALAFAAEAPEGAERDAAQRIADALGDAGKIIAGKVPTVAVRHNRTTAPKKVERSKEIHGDTFTWEGALCPLLALEGVTQAHVNLHAVKNHDTDARVGTPRCPVCLSADVAVTAPKAKAPSAERRWWS